MAQVQCTNPRCGSYKIVEDRVYERKGTGKITESRGNTWLGCGLLFIPFFFCVLGGGSLVDKHPAVSPFFLVYVFIFIGFIGLVAAIFAFRGNPNAVIEKTRYSCRTCGKEWYI